MASFKERCGPGWRSGRRHAALLSGLAGLLIVSTPVAAKVKITVATWDDATGRAPVEKLIADFERLHPDIDVELEPAGTQGYTERIVVGIATNTLPDIFLWWNFPELVKQGVLTDLTPYLETGALGVTRKTWYPAVLNMAMVGGKVYGLPKDFTPRVIYYNMDLFDAAGLPYPSDDWAWDQFLSLAKKLVVPSKQWGFIPPSGSYALQGWVWSNGGDFLSPDGSQALGFVDSPKTVEAVQWLADLRLVHGVAPPPGTVEPQGGFFAAGQLGMMDNGRWPILTLRQNPSLRFGTVVPPHPANGAKRTTIHSSAWVVSATSKYPKEAFTFLAFLAGPPGHRAQAEAGWALPAVPSVAEELGLLRNRQERAFYEALRYATVTHVFMRNSNWWELDKDLSRALGEIFSGAKPARVALTEAARTMQAKLEQLGGALVR